MNKNTRNFVIKIAIVNSVLTVGFMYLFISDDVMSKNKLYMITGFWSTIALLSCVMCAFHFRNRRKGIFQAFLLAAYFFLIGVIFSISGLVTNTPLFVSFLLFAMLIIGFVLQYLLVRYLKKHESTKMV